MTLLLLIIATGLAGTIACAGRARAHSADSPLNRVWRERSRHCMVATLTAGSFVGAIVVALV